MSHNSVAFHPAVPRCMKSLTPAHSLPAIVLDRGVWTAPGVRNGCEALVLVTSSAEYLGPIPVPPGVDRDKVLKSLEALLEVIDPPSPSATAPLTLLRD